MVVEVLNGQHTRTGDTETVYTGTGTIIVITTGTITMVRCNDRNAYMVLSR